MTTEAETGISNAVSSALRYVAIVPLFHVVVTSLYLIGYHFAIGYKLFIFSSPSDLSSVSVGEVGPSYIATVALPVIYVIWQRARTGAWTEHEAILSTPPSAQRDKALENFVAFRKFMRKLLFLVPISQAVIAAISYYKLGYISYMFGGICASFFFLFVNDYVYSKSDMTSKTFHASSISCIVIIIALFTGLASGQNDSIITYINAKTILPSCKGNIILHSIGNKYLAINEKNNHIVIDSSCDLFAYLPNL